MATSYMDRILALEELFVKVKDEQHGVVKRRNLTRKQSYDIVTPHEHSQVLQTRRHGPSLGWRHLTVRLIYECLGSLSLGYWLTWSLDPLERTRGQLPGWMLSNG